MQTKPTDPHHLVVDDLMMIAAVYIKLNYCPPWYVFMLIWVNIIVR